MALRRAPKRLHRFISEEAATIESLQHALAAKDDEIAALKRAHTEQRTKDLLEFVEETAGLRKDFVQGECKLAEAEAAINTSNRQLKQAQDVCQRLRAALRNLTSPKIQRCLRLDSE